MSQYQFLSYIKCLGSEATNVIKTVSSYNIHLGSGVTWHTVSTDGISNSVILRYIPFGVSSGTVENYYHFLLTNSGSEVSDRHWGHLPLFIWGQGSFDLLCLQNNAVSNSVILMEISSAVSSGTTETIIIHFSPIKLVSDVSDCHWGHFALFTRSQGSFDLPCLQMQWVIQSYCCRFLLV